MTSNLSEKKIYTMHGMNVITFIMEYKIVNNCTKKDKLAVELSLKLFKTKLFDGDDR